MRRIIFGAAAAVTLIAGSAALAQTSTTITIGQPEQTRIKEYVVKEKMKPVMMKERVTMGTTLPADVELRSAPSDWGPTVSKYRYIYTDNHVMFVEPSTRRVIHIVE